MSRPQDTPFKLRLSQQDLRIIAAYLGVLEATDDDVNRYAIAAVRSCLDQDECYLRAKTERGRIRARIRKGLK